MKTSVKGDAPIVVEDLRIRKLRFREAKNYLKGITVKVSLIGFSACCFTIALLHWWVGLDNKTILAGIFAPIVLVVGILWVHVCVQRYIANKWTLGSKKISFNDGFWISSKDFRKWVFSNTAVEAIDNYRVVELRLEKRICRQIVLDDLNASRLAEYLELNGMVRVG
ncbi:MAG: hypothetical protein AAFX93_00305 [Verrucomicrobiota bacterium]